MVDDDFFLSAVPGLDFDTCMISLLATAYPQPGGGGEGGVRQSRAD